MLVVIREAECIGCTKCIQACPVDAILGSHNQMHTVITDECIGCELCVPPCPVDCIDLTDAIKPSKNKELTLKRSRARKQRLTIDNAATDAKNATGLHPQINETLARIKALRDKSK